MEDTWGKGGLGGDKVASSCDGSRWWLCVQWGQWHSLTGKVKRRSQFREDQGMVCDLTHGEMYLDEVFGTRTPGGKDKETSSSASATHCGAT